jgi:catechol 2,3-dioxygenase-like lactoylglutathione lyase family enzyme
MFSSGNVTIPVSDMNRAIHFYTEVLGLKLVYRHGDHWASIQVGNTLTIGLHPGAPQTVRGSMSIGLELAGSLDDAMRALEAKGVKFAASGSEGKAGRFVPFADPDGNQLYLAQLDRRHVEQGEGKYPNT